MSYQYSFSTDSYKYFSQKYYSQFGKQSADMQAAMQFMQAMFMCFILIQQFDRMINRQNNSVFPTAGNSSQTDMPFYIKPQYKNYTDFDIPSFDDIDVNKDGKLQNEEFKNYYIKQREEKAGKKYDNPVSPELARIKQEAKNIFNAIKGDEESIGKNRYGTFLDIIDETDGNLDKKYYQNDAQNIIDKVKEYSKSKIKDNKTLAQLIQERLGIKNTPMENKVYDEDEVIFEIHDGEVWPSEDIKNKGKYNPNDDEIKDTPIAKDVDKIKEEEAKKAEKIKELIESAKKKLEDKDYKGAIKDYDEVIKLNPNSDDLYTERGRIKHEAKDSEGAIKDFTKAVEINPKNESAYFNRGEVLYDDGKYDKAINDYTKAIELNPENHEYFSTRAQAYKELKEFDKGIKDLKKAHELYLKNPPNYNYDKNRYLDTIKEFENFKFKQKWDSPITMINQGGIGDCYLLATLAKHPEFIEESDCLKLNDDGSVDVSLYDSEKQYDKEKKAWVYKTTSERKTYHITKEELEKWEFEITDKNGGKKSIYLGEMQHPKLKALEIGYLKANDFDEKKAWGGHSSRALRMLFGDEKYKDMTYYAKAGNYSIDDLKDCVQVSIVCNGKNDESRNIGGQTIFTKHAYTFNSYNPKTGMVSISNPWSNDLQSAEDDIQIPWKQFKDIFRIEVLTASKPKNVHFQPLSYQGPINFPKVK